MTRSFGSRYLIGGLVSWRLFAMLAVVSAFSTFIPARGATPLQVGSSPSTQSSAAQAPSDITVLELGKPIERELGGGRRQSYQVTLSEGQYMKVEIREQGIDVGVSVEFPPGEIIQPWTPLAGGQRIKAVTQVAEISGVYRLDVFAMTKAAPGRYEIRLAELRPATENDRALYEARNLFRDYMRLRDQGKWLEARPLLVRCLEIREKVLGPDDLLVGTTLGFLANSYDYSGDYAAAEPLNLRALKIKEKVLGPDHPNVASHLFDLGVSYRDKGDYLKEEEMQRRAWGILERTQSTETALAGAVLEEFGSINYNKGNYRTAEDYFQRGRVVWEKVLGADHYHLAPSFTFSGRAAYDQGDYAKAETMFQKALILSEKALGQDHSNVTKYRNDLAMLYCTTGDYAQGKALYERSLSAHEQRGTMSYPAVKTTLFGLARCSAAEGNWPEAVKFQSRASEIEEHYIAVNLAVGSEREKQAVVADLSLRSSRNISLQTQFAHDDPNALHLAVTTILQSKGRVQDAVSSNLTALRQRFAPEDHKLLDQLNDLTSQLAKLVLTGPQKLTATEHGQQIKALENQRERLEAEMNQRTVGFYQGSKTITLGAIQAAVPENAALVEFAVYRPFDPKAPDNQKAYADSRYVVYVVRNQGEVQWKELGEARAIDEAIDRLRQALRDPERKDVQQLARAVDNRAMQPLRSLTGDAAHLLISPDGKLNLIPFEALVDEQGHYLTERYLISYLTTGRDLLRMQVVRASKSRPVVVANPLFGEPSDAAPDRPGQAHVKPISTSENRRSVTSGDDLSGFYFAPLRGTAQEARAIQSLFPEAEILTGPQATKTALQRMVAPRILHIATHGFFLAGTTPARVKIENPLLRSGLALTGANLNKGRSHDGILTALEASNLNLWGTKLVTLSACETGVGEVKDGEGVYGLRRSFFEAGTESLVMSLWSISDRSTREMMTAYYAGLKQGLGRGEALRQVQLAMLKRKDRQHPFYWASFIQSGEWANLDGKR